MTTSSAGSAPGKARMEVRMVALIGVVMGSRGSSGARRRRRHVKFGRNDLPNPAPALPRRLAACQARLPVRYRAGCNGGWRRNASAGGTQRWISLAVAHRLRKRQNRSRRQSLPWRRSLPCRQNPLGFKLRRTRGGRRGARADRDTVPPKETTSVGPPRSAHADRTATTHALSLSRAPDTNNSIPAIPRTPTRTRLNRFILPPNHVSESEPPA